MTLWLWWGFMYPPPPRIRTVDRKMFVVSLFSKKKPFWEFVSSSWGSLQNLSPKLILRRASFVGIKCHALDWVSFVRRWSDADEGFLFVCMACHIKVSDGHYAHCNTHCNTLQHTAPHCNTLQHTATHCNTLTKSLCTYEWVMWQVWMSHDNARLHYWHQIRMWNILTHKWHIHT